MEGYTAAYTNESLQGDDTIAAIATPVGEGGIGIIRISGPDALSILRQVFSSGKAAEAGLRASNPAATGSLNAGTGRAPVPADFFSGRRMRYGYVLDQDGTVLDEVMAVYMAGPHSYTAEDVAEIQCHGGPVSLRRILGRALAAGARLAEPGEFTKRAFLHGRLDLTQAEAVIDLIEASSDAGAQAAVTQLTGRYAQAIGRIREKLTDVLVELTVNIDYPDEDIEVLTYETLGRAMDAAAGEIRDLLDTADTGRMVKDGLRAAIIGKPNVGKSSLLNGLLREERAIVTAVPGTTRDTIEETLSLGGLPVRLIDTAGIRQASDPVEEIGIEKSRQSAREADVVLFLLDASRPLDAEDERVRRQVAGKRVFLILNKSDLPSCLAEADVQRWFAGTSGGNGAAGLEAGSTAAVPEIPPVYRTSMTDGSGLSQLKEALQNLVYGGRVRLQDTVLVTSLRHQTLLGQALDAAESARQEIADGLPLELIEPDVNICYQALGRITGESADGEILDQVFSRFCLGK